MGEVVHIFYCLRHRLPMKPVDETEIVLDKGLKDCAHGRPGSRRQVLLIDEETLAELGLEPGAVKENITTRGISVCDLRLGTQVRVGGALLEVTTPCGPCKRMDDIRPGLQQELRGKRGMLCRVVRGGKVRRGDRIELVEAATAVIQSTGAAHA